MDKITVIAVCYNESPDRIRFTLDSIVSQNYSEIELVIVDGGSNAQTLAAISPYKNQVSTLISEPDCGIYDAMNKGVKISTGKWISFMNIGDCFHSSKVLSRMLNRDNLRDNPALIYGDSVLCDSSQIGRIEHVPKKINRWFLYHGTICHQAIIARKTAFETVGLFDTSYRILADKDWLFRFIEKGLSYRHSGIVVCDWDTRGISSNVLLFTQEWTDVVKRRFSRIEQVSYSMFWVFIKIAKRLRSLDFSIPHKLRHSR